MRYITILLLIIGLVGCTSPFRQLFCLQYFQACREACAGKENIQYKCTVKKPYEYLCTCEESQ